MLEHVHPYIHVVIRQELLLASHATVLRDNSGITGLVLGVTLPIMDVIEGHMLITVDYVGDVLL